MPIDSYKGGLPRTLCAWTRCRVCALSTPALPISNDSWKYAISHVYNTHSTPHTHTQEPITMHVHMHSVLILAVTRSGSFWSRFSTTRRRAVGTTSSRVPTPNSGSTRSSSRRAKSVRGLVPYFLWFIVDSVVSCVCVCIFLFPFFARFYVTIGCVCVRATNLISNNNGP